LYRRSSGPRGQKGFSQTRNFNELYTLGLGGPSKSNTVCLTRRRKAPKTPITDPTLIGTHIRTSAHLNCNDGHCEQKDRPASGLPTSPCANVCQNCARPSSRSKLFLKSQHANAKLRQRRRNKLWHMIRCRHEMGWISEVKLLIPRLLEEFRRHCLPTQPSCSRLHSSSEFVLISHSPLFCADLPMCRGVTDGIARDH
jgi:hypothetical protein